jgi:hypothetical protein
VLRGKVWTALIVGTALARSGWNRRLHRTDGLLQRIDRGVASSRRFSLDAWGPPVVVDSSIGSPSESLVIVGTEVSHDDAVRRDTSRRPKAGTAPILPLRHLSTAIGGWSTQAEILYDRAGSVTRQHGQPDSPEDRSLRRSNWDRIRIWRQPRPPPRLTPIVLPGGRRGAAP